MKAVNTELLDLLGQAGRRFVVPIYQRVYSWDYEQCEELLCDIVTTGAREDDYQHFTGSIVYIASDAGTRTSREPDLLIDGQQRVTTVTILLASLSQLLKTRPEDEQDPIGGFSPEDIHEYYLTNKRKTGDEYFKLILSQYDKDALKAVVNGAPLPQTESRVVANYSYFEDRLAKFTQDELADLCRGLSRLVVVDVELSRGQDDPQRVFESMNATGKGLSQADLIRNFVLMDLPTAEQNRLYEDYWFPMELRFAGQNRHSFDAFVRHYLTTKTYKIPKQGNVYDAFKEYVFGQSMAGTDRNEIVRDLHLHATWFANMALDQELDSVLSSKFSDMDQNVAYPFLLRLYADFDTGKLGRDEFLQILDAINSYLFRRAVCDIPTNSLNTTFVSMLSAVEEEHYLESVLLRLLTLPDHRRFPNDAEFSSALQERNFYKFKRARHFFSKIENFGRKEHVTISDYSIEHIMPQNANESWQAGLGDNWQEIHDWYLHTLGNLTLTGYNPEYSDHPFAKKRDMEGGFKQSPLFVNRGIGSLDFWTQETMDERAEKLANQALLIWPRPRVDDSVLEQYRIEGYKGRGFDWTQLHQILEAMPGGKWTSYAFLAEAVGTGAQALATHLRDHIGCAYAYRVLTWNGEISDGFRWGDPNDDRDLREVLLAEGIEFDGLKANREQLMQPEELLALFELDLEV